MHKHISSIIKSCFLQLLDFHRIRPFSSKTAAITQANAFVHSRLDFCNSLFYGLPKYSIHRLQKVQYTVARIVTNSFHFSHVTPTLKSLNWLPVFYRINFKICCITHRALSLGKPFYLNTLLTHRSNTHSLRTTSFRPLLLPYFNKISIAAFVSFLMLRRFFGIIYLILFALHPLTCHLEEISKLIYSTKPFLLRLSSLLDILSLAFDCFVLWLSSLDKVASNLSLLGELATCKSKNFYYYYIIILCLLIFNKNISKAH